MSEFTLKQFIGPKYRRVLYNIIHHPIKWVLGIDIFFILCLAVIHLLTDNSNILSLANSIVGGTIASLTTYALMRYFILENETFGLKRILKLGSSNLWIIPTYLDHHENKDEVPYYVSPPFDGQAASLLYGVAEDIGYKYPVQKIIGSHRNVNTFKKDNLFILCLPHKNQFSRVYLGIFNDIYRKSYKVRDAISEQNVARYLNDKNFSLDYFGLKAFENEQGESECQMRDFSRDVGNNMWLRSSINIEKEKRKAGNIHIPGKILHDYSLIIKAPNPFNPQSTILLICGLHGIGTLAGARYITTHSMNLFEKYGDSPIVINIMCNYTIPKDAKNYVDSELLPSTDIATRLLDEI